MPLPETNKDPLVSKPDPKMPLPLATIFPVAVEVKLTVVALRRINVPVPALMVLPVIVAPERLVNCPETPLITVNKPVLPVTIAPDTRDVNVPETPVKFTNCAVAPVIVPPEIVVKIPEVNCPVICLNTRSRNSCATK
jgi:hypothetical protein